MAWDPAQYLKFGDQRLRPALDLLSRIDVDDPAHVYDLGAGAGNVTRLLRARWPRARVTGVDASAAMLAQAAKGAAAMSDVHWVHADLATWTPPRTATVLFSNAALHWVDDHARVLRAWLAALAPGGVLAVQMPRNFAAPSHMAVVAAARAGPWRATLEPLLRPTPVAEPAAYFDLMSAAGACVDVWETEYLHVLDGEDAVVQWMKGTWLRPLLDALDAAQRAGFEEAYRARVAPAYPRRDDGRTLFPFRRLFLVARPAR